MWWFFHGVFDGLKINVSHDRFYVQIFLRIPIQSFVFRTALNIYMVVNIWNNIDFNYPIVYINKFLVEVFCLFFLVCGFDVLHVFRQLLFLSEGGKYKFKISQNHNYFSIISIYCMVTALIESYLKKKSSTKRNETCEFSNSCVIQMSLFWLFFFSLFNDGRYLFYFFCNLSLTV